MKTFRSKSGPFTEQPYFEQSEIETTCESALRDAGLWPSAPEPIRIDRLVELRFDVNLSYEELPEGILGFTRFGKKGVEAVVISQALDADHRQSAERRLRTTVAHEAGHGLLHAHLFLLGRPSGNLFGDGLDARQPKILCRNGDVPVDSQAQAVRPRYRWWEYQANQAMGALLLPRMLVEVALERFWVRSGTISKSPSLPAGKRDEAIRHLAEVFNVNGAAARIRLDQLYPAAKSAQLTL